MNAKNKHKLLRKKGRLLLVVNSVKGQKLNLREMEDMKNGVMDHILPVEVEMKRKGFALTYDVTNYISLEQYIHTIVNRKKFVEIMLQILNVFQQMAEKYYSTQNLILEMGKIVVKPSTNEILFAFVPILYYDCGVDIKDFLIQLIYGTTFDSTEDTEYVGACLAILQKNMNFSRVELEEYLKSLQADSGETVSGKVNEHNNVQEGYDPFSQLNDCQEKEETPSEQISNGNVQTRSARMTESLSDIGEGGTVLLGTEEISYLKQMRTGKKYYLEQREISIGKQQCAIEIADNPAISRRHARIQKTEEGCFLTDLHATNGTKVNGTKLQPGVQVLLKDGDEVEFANEKFIFYK